MKETQRLYCSLCNITAVRLLTFVRPLEATAGGRLWRGMNEQCPQIP
jgi:hypothetical protein